MIDSTLPPSDPLLAAGDELMRAGRPADAHDAYQSAWNDGGWDLGDPDRQVWLLLAAANANLRAEDPHGAWEAGGVLFRDFREDGPVVGNPLFHLVVGLAAVELDNRDAAVDNLARALICGGPDMFTGEDPAHLDHLKQIMRPPAELGTWDGYAGCSRDRLNGATGHLAELLTGRLGAPPPYAYPD